MSLNKNCPMERLRLRKSAVVGALLFLLVVLVLFFVVKGPLANKIIGTISHPPMQGEMLLEKNIIYSFEKGSLFRHFETDYLAYPWGESLGFGVANSLHLYMYAPLKFFLELTEAGNFLLLFIVLLNFLSAYLLARYLFPSRALAICSGLVFALNTYVLLKINIGFVQKSVLFWIPLYCLCLLKLRDTRKWRHVLAAAVILVAMQLSYPPYAYYALVFTFVLALYTLRERQELKFVLTRLPVIIVVLAVGTFLIYYLMGWSLDYFRPSEVVRSDITTEGCLNLFSPFHFFPYHDPSYPTHLPLGISLVGFLCAVVAFFKGRGLPRLLFFTFLVFLLIASGPYLTRAGQLVHLGGHRIVLPYYLMAEYLPFARGIFFPIRLFPFLNVCLALLTGYGLLYLSASVKWLRPPRAGVLFGLLYLLEIILFFPQLFPPPISDVEIPEFYQEVKDDRCEAVLNLPLSSSREVVNRYGYYAALSGKKMMNSYFKEELPIYFPKNRDSRQQKEEFIAFLSDWKIGYVVVHQEFLQSGEYHLPGDDVSWLESFCELIPYPEDNLSVYRIVPAAEGDPRERSDSCPAGADISSS